MSERSTKELLRRWIGYMTETTRQYSAFLKHWGLSMNAYFALEYLHEHPEGAKPGELAANGDVMPQLITLILKDFEKRGLIVRREDENDHRQRKIQLSSAGTAFAGEVCRAMEQIDLRSLADFSPDEQTAMVEYAGRFMNSVKRVYAEFAETQVEK